MSERFAPKVPVQLEDPKDDPITVEELSKCDGTDPNRPTWVAIKGIVFDVSKNPAYGPNGSYRGRLSPSLQQSGSTLTSCSLCRKGFFPSPGLLISETGGL